MGIFKFLKIKKNRKERFDQPDSTSTEFVSFIKDNMELYNESTKQIKEARIEYQAVTSYLADMQKIDMVPKEHRETLDEAARMVYKLYRQRLKHQEREITISDMQYHLFERYELEIPKDLITIREEEEHKKNIKKDMGYLEEERHKLDQEQEQRINKQGYLKGMGIATFTITILLFAMFFLIVDRTGVNLDLPFIMTILIGMTSALYIFMESRKNLQEINKVNNKIRRQIYLMNKVKIKAVNNYNYLEYIYDKYMIEDYKQFKSLWAEYLELKKEAQEYRTNTERLDHYSNILIDELERFGIKDTERWIYQSNAIIDSREMVELRHSMNTRRGKLREQIKACQNQQEEAIDTITSIIKANPHKEEEAAKILAQYKNLIRQ